MCHIFTTCISGLRPRWCNLSLPLIFLIAVWSTAQLAGSEIPVHGINLLSKLTLCVWTKPQGFLLSQRIFPIYLPRFAVGTPIPTFSHPEQVALHWCRIWVWAWGSHLTVRTDTTLMKFSEDSLVMRIFWGVTRPSEGVASWRFCPGSSGATADGCSSLKDSLGTRLLCFPSHIISLVVSGWGEEEA